MLISKRSITFSMLMGRTKNYIREEVLEKAMKTFWDNGYENTSSRLLQEKMGINQKTMYSEFKSKDQLFIDVLKRFENLNEEVILYPLIHSDGNLKDIQTFFKEFIVAVKSGKSPNGCLFANTSIEFGSSHPPVKERLDSYYLLLHTVFFELLTKTKANGQLSKEANLTKLSNYLVGCTQGLTVTVKVLEEKPLFDFIEIIMKSIK